MYQIIHFLEWLLVVTVLTSCLLTSCLLFAFVCCSQLLGSSADNSVKHGGLLAKMLESCHCTAHREDGALDMHSGVADVGSSWLVLDGPLASQSLDILASLLESWKCLFVENGSSMYTNGMCSM